jgi:hypothetical protein
MRSKATSTSKAKKSISRKEGLASVRGWLDDSDPFFAAVGTILRSRHTRRPRRAGLRRRSR